MDSYFNGKPGMSGEDVAKISVVRYELISFGWEAVNTSCLSDSFEDLSEYVLLTANLPDALITAAWEAYLRMDVGQFESECSTISEDAVVSQMGNFRSYDGRLYIFVQDRTGLFEINFTLEGEEPRVSECHRVWR